MQDISRIQNLNQDLISVCICTYKRPDLLAQTLNGILSQVTEDKFSFEIVVVDNDSMHSAEAVVKKYQGSTDSKIVYDCEPEQNIALTRNRAVRCTLGNFIAFIDDDETPLKDWLYKLLNTLKAFGADGVLGPVLPDFPASAPEWLKKSGLCNRPRNVTGTPISTKDLRTGNILFQRNVFETDEMWFNPSRGLTGGEDGEFLLRQIKKGKKFIWCDEAVVFEIVPEERWLASFYLDRNFLIGTMAGKKARQSLIFMRVIKSIILLPIYSSLFFFYLFIGKHLWMKVLTKVYYNLGCVLSFLKIARVQQR